MGTVWRTISLLLWLAAIPFAVLAALLLHFSDKAKHKSWRVEPLPFGLGWIYWGARRRTLAAFPIIKNLRKQPVHLWCMKQGDSFDEKENRSFYLRAKYAIASAVTGARLLSYLVISEARSRLRASD